MSASTSHEVALREPREGESADLPRGPRRQRGSRGGRRRRGRRSLASGEGRSEAGAPDAEGEHGPREPEGEGAGDAQPRAADSSAPLGPARSGRRRRSRRRKLAMGPDGEPAAHELPFEEPLPEPGPSTRPSGAEAAESGEGAGRRKRRRRGRRKKGGAPLADGVQDQAGEPAAGQEDERERTADEERGSESRRRGRRGGRRRSKKDSAREGAPLEILPGEDDDLPFLAAAAVEEDRTEEGASARGGRGRKRSRKKKGGRAVERGETDEDLDLDEPLLEEVPRVSQILVNALDREEMRVAVVRDGRIVDFQMTVESEDSLVNDIYRGRVVNIEASIGAAFVDFGRGRNGFLHTSDVLPAYGEEGWTLSKLLSTNVAAEDSGSSMIEDELGEHDADGQEESSTAGDGKAPAGEGGGRRPGRQRFRQRPRVPITELLDVGDRVVVQVTKDAIGDKGPTLTTYLSIPGRYLVLMPSITHKGVSRKIEDVKERRRLKRILDGVEIPKGMGVIARTAAAGRSKSELKRDVDYLLGAWERFSRELGEGRGTRTLYRESDVAIRTVRDLFGPDTESVVVDDPQIYESIVEFTKRLMPEQVQRIKLYEGTKPLFHAHGVEQEYERIFSRRIELPSGGSIVFDQAEALVAIDVNSGKTRSDGHDFEEIALKTNLEAVPEIARQIRLRDLGGILVVDFIDMTKRSNMAQVERAFRTELAKDRARSKLGRISQFGLLEMTRQRLGPGMEKKVFTACPRCRGQGRVRTVESRGAAILRRLRSALTLKGFTRVEIKAHPEVVHFLERHAGSKLDALRTQHAREITLVPAPEQLEDSIVRYLRTDGREVRPGGRRKR